VTCEAREHELLTFWGAGTLSSEEVASVERHLRECAECRAAATEARDLVAGLRRLHFTSEEVVAAAWGEGSFPHLRECSRCRDEVETLRAANTELGARTRAAGWNQWLGLAAGVAFVATAASLLLRSPGPAPPVLTPAPAVVTTPAARLPTPDPLEPLMRFDPPEPLSAAERSVTGEPRGFETAMAAYASGDYALAATRFRSVARGEPGHAASRFFLGVAELLRGDATAAIPELRAAAASSDPAYAEAARFHLAKAFLRARDVAAARAELEALSRDAGDYAPLARDLLRELDALGTR
jgi:hypothetical protein